MKKVVVITVSVLLAIGIMFYLLIANSKRSTHMHFTNRSGVLENVIYYSARSSETASHHDCDGNFAEMRDDLYEIHLKLWREKYQGEKTPSP